ncbi:sugar kinase [Alicyclobacillus fodiniaquatilis]|uniref:Sugar kinase n=1 Tax=Alicyclobacillus fodiniaquatilis TaxID=1661150 RepID=A0ABW4JCZ4_9BACL
MAQAKVLTLFSRRECACLLEVVTFGESMVLFTPDSSSLEQATNFTKRMAGAEGNVAVALARLGHQVAWISKLGDDGFGRYIVKTLRGEGVDVQHVQFDRDRPTAVFFKERSELYGTNVQYYRNHSAVSQLAVADVPLADFKEIGFLHVTGITPALSDLNRQTVLTILQRAKAQGIRVSFDPNIRFKLWSQETAIPVLREMAKYASVALPGLEEGELLTGSDKPEAIAAWFLAQGCELVVVKLGSQGAYYQTADTSGYVDGFTVKLVDEVGAGDAFAAGLLSGLLEHVPVADAVRRACALGAIAVCGVGDYESSPTRAELTAFLSGQTTDVKR